MKIFSNIRRSASKDVQKNPQSDMPGPPSSRGWVFFARAALLSGIFAVLLIFGLLSFWPQDGQRDLIATLSEAVLPALVNLRITGQDEQGRPYIITAQSARPKEESLLKGLISQQGHLTGVEANLDLGNEESWISIRSPVGEFDSSRRHFRVGPGFDLYSSAGYQMHGRAASFDLKTGHIFVEGQVDGWGPIGEIIAASLQSSDQGEHLHFYGGVEVVIRPQQNKRTQ